MKEVIIERLKKYLKITEEALKQIKFKTPEKVNFRAVAEDFLDMAQRYYSDANHYMEKGDFVTALAAVSYAHAWLDAGARLGVFDVKNSKHFTID